MDHNAGERAYDPESISIPSYSEDSQEDFTGPDYLVNYGAIHDEALDDETRSEIRRDQTQNLGKIHYKWAEEVSTQN